MTVPVKIDFVSDVVCPWCVIGLKSLEQALARAADAVTAEIHVQPFELNPDMPAGGESLAERLSKYGRSPEEMAQMRAHLRDRAAEVGFEMGTREGGRIYNTFDAHRLLHWAGLSGRQTALKNALFSAYFTRNESLDDPEVLVAAAAAAGLPADEAREVLASGLYAYEVRAEEARWRGLGINSVPSIVINDKYLISGGQPAEVFEQALRRIAAEA
jgi:predicted DsbA family dithiol-disulfide isomerase